MPAEQEKQDYETPQNISEQLLGELSEKIKTTTLGRMARYPQDSLLSPPCFPIPRKTITAQELLPFLNDEQIKQILAWEAESVENFAKKLRQ